MFALSVSVNVLPYKCKVICFELWNFIFVFRLWLTVVGVMETMAVMVVKISALTSGCWNMVEYHWRMNMGVTWVRYVGTFQVTNCVCVLWHTKCRRFKFRVSKLTPDRIYFRPCSVMQYYEQNNACLFLQHLKLLVPILLLLVIFVPLRWLSS